MRAFHLTSRWQTCVPGGPSALRLLILIGLLGLPGCGHSGPVVYPVAGVVRFVDGDPVMFGEIEFQSLALPLNASGKIGRDGSFTLSTRDVGQGAVAGKHRVVINQVVVNHFNLNVVHDHGSLVDRSYASYKTTNLEVEVQPLAEGNTLLIEVQKQPGASGTGRHP